MKWLLFILAVICTLACGLIWDLREDLHATAQAVGLLAALFFGGGFLIATKDM